DPRIRVQQPQLPVERQCLRVGDLDDPGAPRSASRHRLGRHRRPLGADRNAARLRAAPPGRCRREQPLLALRLAAVDPDLPADLLGAAVVKTERIRERLMPWGGLALVTLGAGLGLILVAAGAFSSWRVHAAQGEAPVRRFIAAVSLMSCAIYALAI